MFHGIFKSTAKLKILYMKMLALVRYKDKSLIFPQPSAPEVLKVLGRHLIGTQHDPLAALTTLGALTGAHVLTPKASATISPRVTSRGRSCFANCVSLRDFRFRISAQHAGETCTLFRFRESVAGVN